MSIDERCFPKLAGTSYRKMSDPNPKENCIAHAAERPGQWWDPTEDHEWPIGVPRDYSIDALVAVFAGLGYVPCESSGPEVGWDKIVIYGDEYEYTHVARQLPGDGTWTSKLGREDDINHPTPEALTGGAYGEVVRIMKRRRNDEGSQEAESGATQ